MEVSGGLMGEDGRRVEREHGLEMLWKEPMTGLVEPKVVPAPQDRTALEVQAVVDPFEVLCPKPFGRESRPADGTAADDRREVISQGSRSAAHTPTVDEPGRPAHRRAARLWTDRVVCTAVEERYGPQKTVSNGDRVKSEGPTRERS